MGMCLNSSKPGGAPTVATKDTERVPLTPCVQRDWRTGFSQMECGEFLGSIYFGVLLEVFMASCVVPSAAAYAALARLARILGDAFILPWVPQPGPARLFGTLRNATSCICPGCIRGCSILSCNPKSPDLSFCSDFQNKAPLVVSSAWPSTEQRCFLLPSESSEVNWIRPCLRPGHVSCTWAHALL